MSKVDSMEKNTVEYKYQKNRVEWKCYRIMYGKFIGKVCKILLNKKKCERLIKLTHEKKLNVKG